MKFPSNEIVEQVHSQYPASTKGTVWGVDDTAPIIPHWDNGSGLHVVCGEDKCKIIHED
ncbi:DUF4314 domain-containing protein [[Clostridium] innocuum]|nr:DUF4314 domain-containing protein [[Clostridium] innocuum]